MSDITIDRARFEESTAGDAELGAELVDMFKEQYAEYRQTMRTQLEAGEAQPLSRTAHSLKGASLTMGFVMLSEIAKDIEHTAASGNVDGMVVKLEDLEAAYVKTEADFPTLLT